MENPAKPLKNGAKIDSAAISKNFTAALSTIKDVINNHPTSKR